MLPRPLYAQGPFSWRIRGKARCNDSQVEHYRGDIWAKRAEQFPGLIININKPKIYYQLTAESAKGFCGSSANELHHCGCLFLLVSNISFGCYRASLSHLFPLYRLRCQQIPLINSNSLRCSGSTSFLSFNTQFGVVLSLITPLA